MNGNISDILAIPAAALGKGSPIKFRVLGDIRDADYDMALSILREVADNNACGRRTVFIWPVGPVGYCRVLARLANEYGVSFKNVHVFQMDEYLTEDLAHISPDDPLSFTGYLQRHFISQMDEALRLPAQQHYVPIPGREGFFLEKIAELGGVDTAYGGVGITGHIAFNEPPAADEAITDEEFKALPTRIVKILPETRTINSHTAARGAIDLIPENAITIGMRDILSARRIRFYMNRYWQSGVVRKVLHGDVTRFVPASFFQQHPDATLTVTEEVTAPPIGALR